MDVLNDDKSLNSLINCYFELKNTGIKKVIVNYNWNAFSKNDLLKNKKKTKDLGNLK